MNLDYNERQENSLMWPLSIVLLFATAAPQQSSSALEGAYLGKIPQTQNLRGRALQTGRSPLQNPNTNICFAIRSYHFRRQDGQAPVLAGITNCTPGSVLQQRRVSPAPGLYVPLTLKSNDQKVPE